MPGCATHYLFGADVYHLSDNVSLKKIISQHRASFRLGLQGPDLFFYHLPYLKYQDIRNIGVFMHENQVRRFFLKAFTLLPVLKEAQQQGIWLAYLCGFLCHYVLDYQGHPFVYDRTGYQPGHQDRNAFTRHTILELELDRYFLNTKRGLYLTDLNPAMHFTLPLTETAVIAKALSMSMKNTFAAFYATERFPLTPAAIRFIICEARFEAQLLMDKKERKYRRVSKLEPYLNAAPVLTYKLITDTPQHLRDFLNLNHDSWKNPWAPERVSTDSFPELYNSSLQTAVDILELINPAALYDSGRFKKELSALAGHLGNYSYHSGLKMLFP